MKKKLLLIDADYAPHAYGNRVDIDAIVKTDEWCNHIFDKCGSTNAIFFLSGDSNFRYDVGTLKPYKGNRKDREKPPQYDNIRNHFINKKPTVVINGAEADDGIAMFATHYEDEYEIWLVTDDKDFGQLPYKQLRHSKNQIIDFKHEIVTKQKAITNVATGDIEYKTYTDYRGDFMLYYQMLVGDSIDSIPGVPGIGASNKIFQTEFIKGITVDEARDIVWREYQRYYKEKSAAAYLEQWLLLRLIRTNQHVNGDSKD